MNKAIYSVLIIFISLGINAQVEIYNEDFQTGIPGVYTIIDNDGLTPDVAVSEHTEAWISIIDPQNNLDTVAASTSFFSPIGRADRWLITPAITLGAFGNILKWEAKSHDPSFPDDYLVLISRTDTQLSSFTDTVFNVVNELATWQNREVNLSDSLINNETIHIAFVNRTTNGFKLYIDDIQVFKDDPVGINEESLSKLNIYPNPASEMINITGIGIVSSVEVYSISGRHVLSTNLNSVNLTSLESGRYLMQVTAGNKTHRKLFIKQ